MAQGVFAANVYQQVRFADSGGVHRTPDTGDELLGGNRVGLPPRKRFHYGPVPGFRRLPLHVRRVKALPLRFRSAATMAACSTTMARQHTNLRVRKSCAMNTYRKTGWGPAPFSVCI